LTTLRPETLQAIAARLRGEQTRGAKGNKLPSGKPLTVRLVLDLGAASPLFQRGYLSRMTFVAEIAKQGGVVYRKRGMPRAQALLVFRAKT
jgi:hypothetical protein